MIRADSLEAIWYGGQPVTLPLRVLARGFGAVVRWRQQAYRRGWLASERLPVPVIVVGNLTVGGTGKTPLTLALIDALRERGLRPGVVSRGHGGTARVPTRVAEDTDPRLVGDEPALIRRQSKAPVVVGRDRIAAGRLLLDGGQVDVVIADDGLQHYRLQRDLEICVIDGTRRFGNRRLLPAGPLREPLNRLDTINFRVSNGGMPPAGEWLMRLHDEGATRLTNSDERIPLELFAGGRVHAVAGIGNPRRFFETLRAQRIDVIEHAFSDHHDFSAGDLDFGDNRPVLMTAKDAVKCSAFARDHWWCVTVRAKLPEEFFDAVVARLTRRPAA